MPLGSTYAAKKGADGDHVRARGCARRVRIVRGDRDANGERAQERFFPALISIVSFWSQTLGTLVSAGEGGFLYRHDARASTRFVEEVGMPPSGMPKNFLLAWLLVLLQQHGDAHGYEIARLLRECHAMETEPSTLYHALRRLERDGAIASCWDASECGPARRVYHLTAPGRALLDAWKAALEQYRGHLKSFFELYIGTGGQLG